jgi:uncharacterized SAM-binding protein YcdF (DUF218 family)
VTLVIGCRPLWSPNGRLDGALGRRVQAARGVYEDNQARFGVGGWVVACGGRAWRGVLEADAMKDELVRSGVPGADVLRERCSMTTRENAWFAADIVRRLAPSGSRPVTLVTCEWHMPRAKALFEAERFQVVAVSPKAPDPTPLVRLYRCGREWVSLHLPRPKGVVT